MAGCLDQALSSEHWSAESSQDGQKKKGIKTPFSIFSILQCLSYGVDNIPSLLDCTHS